MSGVEAYQIWDYTLPTGESRAIATVGTYIVCLDATAPFEISVDHGPAQPMEAGLGFFAPEGEEFTDVKIIDTSGAANSIRLAIGRGDFRDSRLAVTGALDLSVASNLTDAAAVTIVTATADALAPTAGQREIIIQADPANTANLQVGATAVPGVGLFLAPGASISLSVATTVYVSNVTGVNQNYSYLKVID